MDESARAVLLTTAAVPLLWGSTYAVTTELLSPGRPLLAGALRALPAGLLLLAVARRLPVGSWWWRSAVLGERVSWRTLVAAVAAAAGVSLTVLTAEARLDPLGVLAGIAGAASMALGLVLTKRWGRPAPVLTVTAWQLTAGGIALLPLALVVEGLPASLSAVNVGGYASLALPSSALAYMLWFRGLERLPAASVSLLGQLSPVVATLIGWALLDQRLTALQGLGTAIALGGVVAGQTARPPTAAPPVRDHPARLQSPSPRVDAAGHA